MLSQLLPFAALHLALLYLWQIDLLRLQHFAGIARTAGLYVISADLPAGQLVPEVRVSGCRTLLKRSLHAPVSRLKEQHAAVTGPRSCEEG